MKIFSSIIILFFLVSCSATYISVYPKQKNGFYIPSEAKKVGLVNRVLLLDNTQTILMKSLDSLLTKRNKKVTTINVSSTVSSNSSILPPKFMEDEVLSLVTMNENLLFSIELLSLIEINSVDKQGLLSSKYIASKKYKGDIGWRIYDGIQGTMLNENVFSLEKTFEYKADSEEQATNFMSYKADSLKRLYFSEVTGEFSEKLFASTKSRIIYTKGALALEEAKFYVKEKDLKTANQIWEEALPNLIDSKSLSKLHHNIAVYYESIYFYDQAIHHANLAEEKAYVQELEKLKLFYNN